MKELFSLQNDLRQLDEKVRGLKHLNQQDEITGRIVRMQTNGLLDEKARKKAEIAQTRRYFIEAIHHITKRAYKELPQFFKFCLFKNKPRRFVVKGKVGEFIEPVKEHINFRGLQAEVTYYEGELGDTDRMVYLAILNEAIRHREFVREFGKIPFSLDELADKAGLSPSGQRQEMVQESLRRLQSTNLFFKHGTGGAHFKDRFHLIEQYSSIEKRKVNEEVSERLNTIRSEGPPDLLLGYFQRLEAQAEELLAKFKPRTPKLTLVKFNEHLTNAILGNEITTVDMWALQRLEKNSTRSLFLYLYDVSQWRTSQEPLEIPITDLMQLMDLTTQTEHKNGKDYPQWNRAVAFIKEIFEEVNQVAQFIEWFEWFGEGEQTLLRVRLSDEVLQIPPK